MAARLDGNGRPSPDPEPEPIGGLLLRALPAVSDPAFPLEHDYFEIVYAPLIGPTGILLARAMARHLDAAAGPTTVGPVELPQEVGIRASGVDPLGEKTHLLRAIDRLAHDRVDPRRAAPGLGVHLSRHSELWGKSE